MEDREEVPGNRKHPWSTRARKKTECPLPQLLKNTRETLWRNLRRSCRTLATAAGVSKSTMHQLLRDDLGVKLFKMLHRPELTDNHVAMRAQKCREILQKMADGTPNLVFTDKKKFRHWARGKLPKWQRLGFLIIHRWKDRYQTPKIRTLSWFGRLSQRPGDSLCFLCPL